MEFQNALDRFTNKLTTYCTANQKVIIVKKSRFIVVQIADDGDILIVDVYYFIANQDGQNRILGSYGKGDIFAPASWNRPANIRLGNIFMMPLTAEEF